MRQRLSSNFVTFNKVNAKKVYKDFFQPNGTLHNEEGIESVINAAIMEATSNKMKVYKYNAPKRGVTDGYIIANITVNGEDVENFYGIQEVKKGIKRNSAAYKQQINQNLLYGVQYDNVRFGLISADGYFDYFFYDECKFNREEYLEYLKDDPPSKACKKIKGIPEMKIYHTDMPENTKIHEVLKTIYKHCIEL